MDNQISCKTILYPQDHPCFRGTEIRVFRIICSLQSITAMWANRQTEYWYYGWPSFV